MTKKSGGLGALLTGVVLGAAAVFLSKKENRTLAKNTAKKVVQKTKAQTKLAKTKAKRVVTIAKTEGKKVAKTAEIGGKKIVKEVTQK